LAPLDKRFDHQKAVNFTPEELDKYILANVMLPRGDGLLKGRVARHKRGHDRNPIGTADRNTILDTREYEVTFKDGTTEAYTANFIAENLYYQVNNEGLESLFMDSIIGHRKNRSAISKR
jgi:hypothetical protein